MHAGPNVPKSRKSQFSTLRKEEDEMRARYAILCGLVVCCLLVSVRVQGEDTYPVAATASNSAATASDPLLQLLVSKGVLNAEEAKSLSGTPAQQRARLLELLRQKGVLSAADYDSLTTPSASAQVDPNLVASTSPMVPLAIAQTPAPKTETKPEPPKFIPAVAPVRVLPIDPPVKDGMIPALKLGAVKMTPYGLIKATVVHDSSDPRGDDFIVPGFLNADTGPNTNPAFHVKARATRFGANFEWPDMEKKLTLTGKVEGDFEGNFSRVDNRNVSTIRSNMPQLRLAYARLDYAASEKTDVFLEGGQNWTLYGSTALPNLLETTFLGAYWGDTYERSPQIRFGLVQKFGGSRNFKFSPEFAVMMPSEGNVPADATITSCTVPSTFVPGTTTTIGCTSTVVNGLGNQLGYGERQGGDSSRPELEARAVLQFQLDKAPGVAPAQLIVSGFDSRREAIVLRSAIAAPAGSTAAVLANYAAAQAAFPHGATTTSDGYGLQVAAQLPTRWVTVVGSAYRGADLRFFFAGQLLSNFTDTGGLINTVTAPSVDRSSTVTFGQTAAGQPYVVAPQRSIRGYGGFVNVGFPLSRWFKANPAGHNAGWTLYLHSGLDAVNHSDFARSKPITATSGGGPWRSTLQAVSLFHKLNNWCTFGYELSLYSSYALPDTAGVYTSATSVAGVPSRTWRDLREEFGPIFTF